MQTTRARTHGLTEIIPESCTPVGVWGLLQLWKAGVGLAEEVSDVCQVSQVGSRAVENANDAGLVAGEGSGFSSS